MTFDPQAWQSAEINEDGERTSPPPPGDYEVTITDARAFTSKANNSVLIVDMKVLGGEQTGHEWSEMRGFGSDGAIKAAKAMCSRMGIDVATIASLDELDTAVKDTIGFYYAVRVVQNGDYRNTYVNDRVTGVPSTDVPVVDTRDFKPAAVGAGAGVQDDDDIPF